MQKASIALAPHVKNLTWSLTSYIRVLICRERLGESGQQTQPRARDEGFSGEKRRNCAYRSSVDFLLEKVDVAEVERKEERRGERASSSYLQLIYKM